MRGSTTILYMKVRAPAKVNLFLGIRGVRPDGYRELETVIQAVGLYDVIEVTSGDGLSLYCSDPSVPADGRNLAMKAARLLIDRSGERKGASIRMEKRIPVAGGMGGGSSDGAAVLKALNELWGLGYTRERLVSIAACLGSDVPFFVDGPVALCRGRGEIVEPLDSASDFWVVLVNPREPLYTKAVYGELGDGLTGEDRDAGAVIEGLKKGDLGMIAGGMHNELDGVACRLLPVLDSVKKRLLEAGCPGAMVSGSGPTVFGIAETEQAAREIASALRKEYPGYFVEAAPALTA